MKRLFVGILDFIKWKMLPFLQRIYINTQFWIVLGVLGIWVIVLQNFGVFTSNDSKTPEVYVTGGYIDAVNETVDVYVEGGDVDVDGEVSLKGGYTSIW